MLPEEKRIKISEIRAKIRKLDDYAYDAISDFRSGDNVNMENVHKSIKKADILRKELTKLGGKIPKNPNTW
jgi:hypothetical protein